MPIAHKLNRELQEYIVRAVGAVTGIVGAGATLGGGFDDLRLRFDIGAVSRALADGFLAAT